MGFGAYDESEQEKQDVHLNTDDTVEVADTRASEEGELEFETGDADSLIDQYKQMSSESGAE